MRKFLALLLALAMAMTCACAFADEAPALCGGWYVPADQTMTEDAMTAFEKATENLDNIEPLLLMGTQVVAGINYAILAKVTYENEVYFAVLTIYADLAGNATIMNENIIDLNPWQEEIIDGQNPVMNFIGVYQDEAGQRAVLNIEAFGEGGDNGALLTLTWANTAEDGMEYIFACEFDTETLTFTYDQGVKKHYTAGEDGTITYEILAEGLKGTFTVQEDDAILWNAEGEDAENGCRFVFVG